jgi:hypothetical protein
VGLATCDQNWGQQFIYDDSDGSIQLQADAVACVDGAGNSPAGVVAPGVDNKLGSRMKRCYHDATKFIFGSPAWFKQKEHQQWRFDLPTKQLRLVQLIARLCGILYI